jgi:hypothetical protein
MSMLLVLAFPACSLTEVNVTRGHHKEEPCDTAGDSGGDADADTDADADADADADTDTTPPDPEPSWTLDTLEELAPADSYRWTTGLWLTDMTGDGIDDLVVASNEYDSSGVYRFALRMYESRGNGRFANPTVSEGSTGSYYYWAPVMADFDDDGQMDVVIAGQAETVLFRGKHNGFADPVATTLPPNMYVQSLGAADFDGNGVRDLAAITYNTTNGNSRVFLMTAGDDGHFTVTHSSYSSISYAYGMVPVDLDGDGRETAVFGDFVTGSGYDLQLGLYEGWGGSSTISFNWSATRFSNDGTQYGFGTDVNDDGAEELISQGTDGLQVYDSEEGHAVPLRLNDFESYPTGLVGYDLDGNGEKDALESLYFYQYDEFSTRYGQRFAWTLQNDDGFEETQSMEFEIMPGYGNTLAAGDPNVDGCGDVVFVDGYGAIHLGLGNCGD